MEVDCTAPDGFGYEVGEVFFLDLDGSGTVQDGALPDGSRVQYESEARSYCFWPLAGARAK